MKFGVERRADPSIDITPMIDIVFQLVLFFMVSTTFISSPGFQVDLPRASAQTVVSEDRDLNVWMTCAEASPEGACRQGPVYIDDQPVDDEQLLRRFERAGGDDPSTLVVIKADQGVPHGRVVRVMDLARANGLTRLAIATEVEPGQRDED